MENTDDIKIKPEETEALNNIGRELTSAKSSLADLTVQFEIQKNQMVQKVIELDRKLIDRVTEVAKAHGMSDQERWQLDLDYTVFKPMPKA